MHGTRLKPSLFTKIFDDRSLDEAIETAADVGYDGVEIMARDPHLPPDASRERAEEVRAVADRCGVALPCLATYTSRYASVSDEECEEELATFERYLELSAVLDVELLRHLPGGPSVHHATDEDFERAAEWLRRAAEWLRRAADRATAYDRTIGLEIHSHMLAETVESTLRLVDAIDRDNVGVIHDAGNMFIAADDFGPASVDRLGDHLAHVHVKDLSRIDDPDAPDALELETQRGEEVFRHELLGDGHVDHGPLFGALADRGYEGFVSMESNVQRTDPRSVAEHELTAAQRLIDDVS